MKALCFVILISDCENTENLPIHNQFNRKNINYTRS